MSRVRSVNTKPEILLRKALWAKGIRYSINNLQLRGKPDLILPSRRVAIFVDGDLWHGNQWHRRGKRALEDQFKSTRSSSYWVKKIRRNIQRDCEVTNDLMRQGWTVLRFWESDIEENLDRCVEITLRTMKKKDRYHPSSLLPRKSFAEFFAGIGLVRMALELHGWNARFANDIDEKKNRMYEAHFGEPLIIKDVADFVPGDIPNVTLATASFPCNDLSLAGSRGGLKVGSSAAFWDFIKVLGYFGAHKSPLILLENVPGFLTSNNGLDLRDALLALNELGYVVDIFMLDAVHFVPHSRKRLFVVGALDSLVPQSKKVGQNILESIVRPKALVEFMRTNSDIRWEIRNLPDPPKRTSTLQDVLDDLPEDAADWWSKKRVDYLLKQMSSTHRAQVRKMIEGRNWAYGTVFRRMREGRSMAELRTDGIAGCLRTPRGGSGRQILIKAGKGKCSVRLLNAKDAARLMGADAFQTSGSRNQALFGFGDAVCVPVVEWIAQYYLNPLVNELIHSVPLIGNGNHSH